MSFLDSLGDPELPLEGFVRLGSSRGCYAIAHPGHFAMSLSLGI